MCGGNLPIPVRVVMPCYNSEKYIGATLDSTLQQTSNGLELIIINNDSTDRTLEASGNSNLKVSQFLLKSIDGLLLKGL